MMGLLADNATLPVVNALATPIDLFWIANYPLSYEWRRAALMGNLGIAKVDVVISGETFTVYQTTKSWVFRLRDERNAGNCQLSDPLDISYTIGSIPAPPSPPAAAV